MDMFHEFFLHKMAASARRRRNEIVIIVQPGDDEQLQLPPTTSEVVATPTTISSIAQSAPAGTLVLMEGDNYGSRTIRVNNGTAAQPVVFIPQDRTNPVTFEQFFPEGQHGYIAGVHFNQASGSTANRLVRGIGRNWTIAHCRFSPNGVGFANEQASAVSYRLHRCLFDAPTRNGISGSTGGSALKIGGHVGSQNQDMDTLIDYCLFNGPYGQREMSSFKGAKTRVIACTINQNESTSRDFAIRHADACTLRRIRINGGGDIFCNGRDHIVRDVVCRNVVLARGTDDGDLNTASTNSFYLSAVRNTVQNVTGALIIDGVPFTDVRFDTQARDNSFSNISGGVTDGGANTTAAPTVTAEIIPDLQTADVGLDAYATFVTGAR